MKYYLLQAILLFCIACKPNKQADQADTGNDTIPVQTKEMPDSVPEETKKIIPPPVKNQMMEGTIMMKGGSWIIRGTNELSEMKDYFPSNLSEEFWVEGIRVEFKGVISEIPPNVRMVGVPITLTEIDRIK